MLNGKSYIGSSVDVHKRIREHIRSLTKGQHHSYKLQKEFDRLVFGAELFEITYEVLFECNPEDIESIERIYMKGFQAVRKGYNVTGSTKRTKGNAIRGDN